MCRVSRLSQTYRLNYRVAALFTTIFILQTIFSFSLSKFVRKCAGSVDYHKLNYRVAALSTNIFIIETPFSFSCSCLLESEYGQQLITAIQTEFVE